MGQFELLEDRSGDLMEVTVLLEAHDDPSLIGHAPTGFPGAGLGGLEQTLDGRSIHDDENSHAGGFVAWSPEAGMLPALPELSRGPMPFFKSHPADAGPANVFTAHPEIYRTWSTMSEALMNGPSPLSPAERELILAYAAGVAGCKFVCVAHSAVAYAHGVREGLIEQLLQNPETAPVEPRLRPLLAFVCKLAATPGEMIQADADAVFAAGWTEQALHDAIAVTARAAFMQRIVEGHGFTPMSPEHAAKRASQRLKHGYVNLYPAFRPEDSAR